MAKAQDNPSTKRAKIPTRDQVSAGGVAFRRRGARAELVLISVGSQRRWQLPKGLIEPGESPEAAAVREVREETGIETDVVAPIDTIEYWYVGRQGTQRVRFHKRVHFFLLAYRAGHTGAHDHEVNDAQWLRLDRAKEVLAFENERRVVAKAEEMIEEHE